MLKNLSGKYILILSPFITLVFCVLLICAVLVSPFVCVYFIVTSIQDFFTTKSKIKKKYELLKSKSVCL